jgi:glycosyltransferase involved in cell wall biosynthesis
MLTINRDSLYTMLGKAFFMKSVFLKGRSQGGLPHSLYEELLRNPPDGYRVFAEKGGSIAEPRKVVYTKRQTQFDKVDRRLQGSSLARDAWREARTLLYVGIKTAQFLRQANEPNSDLIYASQQFVSGDRPWIVDFEFADALVDYGDIRMSRRFVKNALASKFCKKIIPWSEWSKRTLLRSVDCSSFKEKIDVVHFGVGKKTFAKKKENNKIRMLFVGSTNHLNYMNFEWKGGIEVVDAFLELDKRYDVELIVRSWAPPEIAAKCAKNPNIKLISSTLSDKELSNLYASSDIFMFPSYLNLGMVILEAMSYELPVIAPNIFDVPEAVKDMETGVLLESPKVPFYAWNGEPNHYNLEVLAGVRRVRNWRIAQVIEKTSLLIENGDLRRRIGRNARRLVEEGEFSLLNRNRKLKRIFDEATQTS